MRSRALSMTPSWTKFPPVNEAGVDVATYGNEKTGTLTFISYSDSKKVPLRESAILWDAKEHHSELKVTFTNGVVAQGRAFWSAGRGAYVLDTTGTFLAQVEEANRDVDEMHNSYYYTRITEHGQSVIMRHYGNEAEIPAQKVLFSGISQFNTDVASVEVVRDAWEIAGVAKENSMIFYRTDEGWFADGNGPFTVEELYKLPMIADLSHYNVYSLYNGDSARLYWNNDHDNRSDSVLQKMNKAFSIGHPATVEASFKSNDKNKNSFDRRTLTVKGSYTVENGDVFVKCENLSEPVKILENGEPVPGVDSISVSVKDSFWATDPIILESATGTTWARYYDDPSNRRAVTWLDYKWCTHDGQILNGDEIDYSKFERHPNILAEIESISPYELKLG